MKLFRSLLGGIIAGAAALAVSSCAYDPYYEGSSYSGGYGDGNGYGSSGFSSSVFISTGSPRWGYDPYAGAYYDYTRRSYYDPYLCGYYPVGYRPRYVHGAPHPHGWRHGRDYIAPPSRIRHTNLSNYHRREHHYGELGHDWSGNVGTGRSGSHYGGRHRYEGNDGGYRRGGENHHRYDNHQQNSPQQPHERGDGRGRSRWDNTAVVAPELHRDPGGDRSDGGGRRVRPQRGEEGMRALQQRIQQQQQQQQQQQRSVPQTQSWSPPAVPSHAAPQMREHGSGGGFERGNRGGEEGPSHRGRGRERGLERLQGLGEG